MGDAQGRGDAPTTDVCRERRNAAAVARAAASSTATDRRTAAAMKVLHTSDWHLGARIGRLDRADDAFARIAELMAVILHVSQGHGLGRAQPHVDDRLVAGDVFDEARTLPLGGLVRRLSQ